MDAIFAIDREFHEALGAVVQPLSSAHYCKDGLPACDAAGQSTHFPSLVTCPKCREIIADAETGNLEAALNRLLWKMPKPPGCETAEDVGLWMQSELRDAGVSVSWHPTEQRMVDGTLAFSHPTGKFVKVETRFSMPAQA